ncbi:uncharacterized protein P884DRAFT_321210 [Thermothelomyces heterothallicus CBS 202.75]|uniref:uncharacterized protein n=1 Tax=Thermothelomyces heterothallicus CBS 202.75 TaxID=1149848 RepID=UPI003744260A
MAIVMVTDVHGRGCHLAVSKLEVVLMWLFPFLWAVALPHWGGACRPRSFEPRDSHSTKTPSNDAANPCADLDPPSADATAVRATREGAKEAEASATASHVLSLQQIDSIYRSDTGLFWPPQQDPSVDLYATLNPPGYAGNTHGSWDERSMVYATGGAAGGL